MRRESRKGILDSLDTKTKVIGLVTIVLEVTYLASLKVLESSEVIWALIVSALVFVTVIIGVIVLEVQENKGRASTGVLQASPFTPDSPFLKAIIEGAMHTVCRSVTTPK